MRKILLYAGILSIFALSCTPIAKLEPNQKNSFLKFYAETNQMEAQDVQVVEDGYVIVAWYNSSSSVLIKTDLLGNKLWAVSLDNFLAKSIAIVSDGYIIAGDGINTQTASQTFMQLIKTNQVDGTITGTATFGNGSQFGAAVTNGASNSLFALGYSANDSVMLHNYDANLNRQWQRAYAATTTSQTIIEENNLLHFLTYTKVNNSLALHFTRAAYDAESPTTNLPLFNEVSIADTKAELSETAAGYAVCQTIRQTNNQTKVGIAYVSNGVLGSEYILNEGEFAEGNYLAGSVIDTGTGLLVAYATNRHPNPQDASRTDYDLALTEVNFDGTPTNTGIALSYGGIGDEIPVRVRKTNDGGYLILGNSTNSKGAKQLFLLKTNNQGLLEE